MPLPVNSLHAITISCTGALPSLNSAMYSRAVSYTHLLQHLFNNWFLSLELGRITAAAVIVVGVMLAGAGALWALLSLIHISPCRPPTKGRI